uniref:Cytochrome P450 n=1 Tax=Quercus lobata TaxID=97700 RepID=A0A7N2MII0_QUELO
MKREDILSRFLQVTETDPTYLRDIILHFIIVGKDTTAITIAWFIYMVCKHPAVQSKIAKEVKEPTACLFFIISSLRPTCTMTCTLPPLVSQMSESSFLDAEICFSDDTLPDGYSVNKGDIVAYQPYAMGRMKFIWGDETEEFRPERWLNEEGIFQPESPFKFTAFQAGPQICVGKEFAYRQMKIFSAVLLGCFEFKVANENRTVNYRTIINLHIDGGLEIGAFHKCGK